jgi:hypothetical protein
VTVDVAPTRAAADFTPGATTSTGDDSTAKIDVTITKSRKVSWHLTGEQQRSLANATISQDWVKQLVKQGMRTLRNECEVDAAIAVKVGASRAFGTAGTTPFATDLTALTNARKILIDNGAPKADLQMVFDTNAGLNLRNLGVLQNAYQAGSDAERRTGEFLPQMGFRLSESAGIGVHTKGTGASYTTSGTAGFAVGTTSIPLITGTGTVLAGDVVTFAGDTNKYVVTTGVAAAGHHHHCGARPQGRDCGVGHGNDHRQQLHRQPRVRARRGRGCPPSADHAAEPDHRADARFGRQGHDLPDAADRAVWSAFVGNAPGLGLPVGQRRILGHRSRVIVDNQHTPWFLRRPATAGRS